MQNDLWCTRFCCLGCWVGFHLSLTSFQFIFSIMCMNDWFSIIAHEIIGYFGRNLFMQFSMIMCHSL